MTSLPVAWKGVHDHDNPPILGKVGTFQIISAFLHECHLPLGSCQELLLVSHFFYFLPYLNKVQGAPTPVIRTVAKTGWRA